MTMIPEGKTTVTVKPLTVEKRNVVCVSLAPVRTGPNGDSSYTVEMWLTLSEARRLRDDLTRTLAERCTGARNPDEC